MATLFRGWLLPAAFISILMCNSAAYAQNSQEQDTEAQLETLQLEISEIQIEIAKKQSKKGALQTCLADAEKSIGKLE